MDPRRNETIVEVREFKDGYYQPVVKREGTGHVTAAPPAFQPVQYADLQEVGADDLPNSPSRILVNVDFKQERRMQKLMTPEDMMSEPHALTIMMMIDTLHVREGHRENYRTGD